MLEQSGVGGSLFATEATLLTLFVVIIFVGLAARVFRLPYTTVLVLAGLCLAASHFLPRITLTPEVVLLLFLPPLLFEASFHLDLEHFREDITPIAVLAVAGVFITMMVAGGVMALALGWPIGMALLFGTLIAATDPVSVVAVFRELGVPRRLSTIVEAESLLNDGTGIVLFRLVLALVLAGTVNPAASILEFTRLVAGGVLFGGVAGFLASRLLTWIDDYLIEISVTVALAWGTYLLAENELFPVSGVIAVVTAGLVLGNYGGRVSFSPTTKIVLTHVLEFIAFVANSFIFLLIGLQFDLGTLASDLRPIVWAIAATLLARAVVVYGLSAPLALVSKPIPTAWRHLMFWGGLRGGLSLALALSLPQDIPFRQVLIISVFGVVLFTLVVQGITVQPLLNLLGMGASSESEREHEEMRGKLLATRAADRRLSGLRRLGVISEEAYEAIHSQYATMEEQLRADLRALHLEHAVLTEQDITNARVEGLRAEKAALLDMNKRGLISDGACRRLTADIDAQLQEVAEVREDRKEERAREPDPQEREAP